MAHILGLQVQFTCAVEKANFNVAFNVYSVVSDSINQCSVMFSQQYSDHFGVAGLEWNANGVDWSEPTCDKHNGCSSVNAATNQYTLRQLSAMTLQ